MLVWYSELGGGRKAKSRWSLLCFRFPVHCGGLLIGLGAGRPAPTDDDPLMARPSPRHIPVVRLAVSWSCSFCGMRRTKDEYRGAHSRFAGVPEAIAGRYRSSDWPLALLHFASRERPYDSEPTDAREIRVGDGCSAVADHSRFGWRANSCSYCQRA
jgi:hypothetical protein